MKNKILEIIDRFRLLHFIPLLVMLISVPVSAEQACPYYSLGGKSCGTITDAGTCPLYAQLGSNGGSNIACSWNGSSCTDGGGDCTGTGVLPTCPANSLNGSDCGTITDPATCPTYVQISTSGGNNIACSWNGSACSNGGGDCTGGGSDSAPPACPANSLNGSGCSTITSSQTCGTYYQSGSSPIACYWNGSSCSDGGGLCTAQAQSSTSQMCSGNSGGWSIFNNGNNYEGYDQICGSMDASGNMAINAFDTQTWINYSPYSSSSPGWNFWDGCSYVSNSAVTVTTTGDVTVNPWSATATNWDPFDNYNWATGVMWGYGTPVNSSNGQGDYTLDGSQAYSNNVYGQLELFNGDCSSSGNMTLQNFSSSTVNSSTASPPPTTTPSCPSGQSWNGTECACPKGSYYNEDGSCVSDGGNGDDPIITSSQFSSNKMDPRSIGSVLESSSNAAPRAFNTQKTDELKKKTDSFKIAEFRIKLSSTFKGGVIGGLNALCPSGFIPMSSAVLSDSSKGRAISQLTDFGAVVSAPSSLARNGQLLCI